MITTQANSDIELTKPVKVEIVSQVQTSGTDTNIMGKVSNTCTCPDSTYANCRRTSHCPRCGTGYCTYGPKWGASDLHSSKKGYCGTIWDDTVISNRKNSKSPYDKTTSKICDDNFKKYGSNGIQDYQNLGFSTWERYNSNKVGRYPSKTTQRNIWSKKLTDENSSASSSTNVTSDIGSPNANALSAISGKRDNPILP